MKAFTMKWGINKRGATIKIKNFNHKNAAKNLRHFYGNNPDKDKGITIYTMCESIPRSGMSRVLKLYIIKHDEPFCIGHGRVSAFANDVGFHCALEVCQIAYPSLPLHNYLHHKWL